MVIFFLETRLDPLMRAVTVTARRRSLYDDVQLALDLGPVRVRPPASTAQGPTATAAARSNHLAIKPTSPPTPLSSFVVREEFAQNMAPRLRDTATCWVISRNP